MAVHGANPVHYLDSLLDELSKKWPDNRTVNIVCHGHSVPAGYFATPFVNTFEAYPHKLHRLIKERFPFAVVNVIVTAIGGENSLRGSERYEEDVLCHKPDLVIIDYVLNDRRLSLECMERAWRAMTEKTLAAGKKLILLTGGFDRFYFSDPRESGELAERAELVRRLADEYGVGLADSLSAWLEKVTDETDLANMLSHVNHPSGAAHTIIAGELGRFFQAR